MKCVEWSERLPGNGRSYGFCVEVKRDDEATNAETLCGRFVTLPSTTVNRTPTCAECLAALAASRLARKEAGHG